MSSVEQVEDNTGYMREFQPLCDEEKALLARVAEAIHAKSAIACTNCRYCATECPQNIPIPDYFGLYNNLKRIKNTSYMSNQDVYYTNLAKNHGKASECIGCGLCEKNCPQNLPVRDLLRKVAAEME
jgi:predicted aldo/keto reductase-like oxidoreductase